MIRGLGTVLTVLAILFFPWQVAAFLALVLALSVPLLPLAAGILFDTLYYAPGGAASGMPFMALFGAVLTAAAFIVRSKLDTGIIEK